MYSKFVFSQNVDNLNDGFLITYEIYNLQIPSQIIALNSCYTGFGKLNKGEGIMNLSRAFIYAGCKYVIISLWPVKDISGSQLLLNFYKYLKKGKTKS